MDLSSNAIADIFIVDELGDDLGSTFGDAELFAIWALDDGLSALDGGIKGTVVNLEVNK